MNTVGVVLRKELRAYFLSPIALIFIAVFLMDQQKSGTDPSSLVPRLRQSRFCWALAR